MIDIDTCLDRLPLVAILRGVRPDEVEAVASAIADAGFCCIEVPLNSPEPFESIGRLVSRFSGAMLVGAGTVLDADAVERVAAAGGGLVVAPNFAPQVVARALDAGLACVPGVATPSEAFAAIDAGTHVLKAFPAEGIPPAVIKAWRAVLPGPVELLPVGGIEPETMAAYVAAGASGFGLGSALYRPGMGAAEVGERAKRFADTWASIADG